MTKGAIILAVSSLVLSTTVFSLMIYILITGEQLPLPKDKNPAVGKNVTSHPFFDAFDLHFDKTSTTVIVSFVLVISFLTMIFSVLLMIGIKKNKPGFVVAYFGFGVLLCLLLLITALLELLEFLWYTSVLTAVFTFILMERLSVVYSVYENMLRDSDSNLLLEADEPNDQEAENINSD